MYKEYQCPKCNKVAQNGYCPTCDYDFQAEYARKQSKATTLVSKAIAAGQLIRPDTCELCSVSPGGPSLDQPKEVWWAQRSQTNKRIMGHHWRGYDDDAVLDLWWICASCNVILRGQKYHNGSVSKEEARAVIEASRKAKQNRMNQSSPGIKLKNYKVAFEVYLNRRFRYEVLVFEAVNQSIAIDFAREFAVTETGSSEVRLLWSERYYGDMPNLKTL